MASCGGPWAGHEGNRVRHGESLRLITQSRLPSPVELWIRSATSNTCGMFVRESDDIGMPREAHVERYKLEHTPALLTPSVSRRSSRMITWSRRPRRGCHRDAWPLAARERPLHRLLMFWMVIRPSY